MTIFLTVVFMDQHGMFSWINMACFHGSAWHVSMETHGMFSWIHMAYFHDQHGIALTERHGTEGKDYTIMTVFTANENKIMQLYDEYSLWQYTKASSK